MNVASQSCKENRNDMSECELRPQCNKATEYESNGQTSPSDTVKQSTSDDGHGKYITYNNSDPENLLTPIDQDNTHTHCIVKVSRCHFSSQQHEATFSVVPENLVVLEYRLALLHLLEQSSHGLGLAFSVLRHVHALNSTDSDEIHSAQHNFAILSSTSTSYKLLVRHRTDHNNFVSDKTHPSVVQIDAQNRAHAVRTKRQHRIALSPTHFHSETTTHCAHFNWAYV